MGLEMLAIRMRVSGVHRTRFSTSLYPRPRDSSSSFPRCTAVTTRRGHTG